MGELCVRFKLSFTAATGCQTGQNKGRYRKQEHSLLLVSLPQEITYCSGAYLFKENNSLIIKSVLEWLGAFAWEI